jgi:predicted phage terminase large subunit-like protein
MRQVEFRYGIDPTGNGFYWAASEQKRSEWNTIKRNDPMTAESTYQCRPGAREGTVFLESDFDYYQPPEGLSEGVPNTAIAAFCNTGALVAQAWDTGMSAKSNADYTVCITALLVPCDHYHCGEDATLLGECEAHYDVFVLDIYRARLDIGDLVKAGREQFQKWAPSIVVIEKKAHGAALMQALENSGIPMEAVTPTDSKRKRAVTAIGGAAGSTQGWFRQHRVRLPLGEESDDWVQKFKTEMKDFTGQEGAKDDQVDAAVHLVNYAIREGGSGVTFSTGWQTPEQVDQQMRAPVENDIWSMLNDPDASDDPFYGLCGRCVHYTGKQARDQHKASNRPGAERRNFCLWHQRVMASLATCDDYTSDQQITRIPR